MDTDQTKHLIANFIDTIWNKQQYDKLSQFLHPNYIDHSLPAALSPGQTGLLNWIQATSQSFSHQTLIDDQVTEGDKTMLKIKMVMTHIGEWRGIAPSGAQVSTTGFRFYRVEEGKIIEHWAMIDGASLETQLRQQSHQGCKKAE